MLELVEPSELWGRLPGLMTGAAQLAPAHEPSAAVLAALDVERPIDPSIGVVIATSGSTGVPKAVELSVAALTASAAATRSQLGGFTWTCALPTEYVAGVMVLVRGYLDRELGLGEGVRFAASDLSDLAPAPGRNAISLVPTQLTRAVEQPSVAAQLARYDAILVGGAALSPTVLDKAADLGLAIIRTYGMSETAGGVVYDGVPLPGVNVSVADTGRVALTTASAFSRYRGRSDLTAEVLDGQTVLTNDRGEWRDGKLRILGRFDDVVISGGVNVDLAAVQRVVDGVEPSAVIFAIPDEEWGSRIMIADPSGRQVDWWRGRLADQLGAPALPKGVLAGEIPRTISGKIDRQQLARLGAEQENARGKQG